MKKIITFSFLLFFIKSHAQDTIVNYLDKNYKKTTPENVKYIKEIIKKDSLWQITIYDRVGNLRRRGLSKTKNLKAPVGQLQDFARNGQMIRIFNFNTNGGKDGIFASWFDDGTVSIKGHHVDDKKEGVWYYYHHNGQEANKVFYVNDSILRYTVKDEIGNILNDTIINKKGGFKGGEKKFAKYVQSKLMSKLSYKIDGKIHVHLLVDTDGKIDKVSFDEKIPGRLENQITRFFIKSPAWKPRIHMNRKIRTEYSLPLNFKR